MIKEYYGTPVIVPESERHPNIDYRGLTISMDHSTIMVYDNDISNYRMYKISPQVIAADRSTQPVLRLAAIHDVYLSETQPAYNSVYAHKSSVSDGLSYSTYSMVYE